MDGFASAWAFHILRQDDYLSKVDYIPMSYGKAFEHGDKILNADVYILDFSFPRTVISSLALMAKQIVILDHHKTAQEALENWEDKPENVDVVFDMTRSGAGITWDYFSDKFYVNTGIPLERPELIRYIEDRDIWKWTLIYSKEISARIQLAPFDFDAYTELRNRLEDNFRRVGVISEGEVLLAQQRKYHEQLFKLARPIKIAGNDGLAVNCPGFFASEVGNMLAEKSGTFGATYYHDSDDSVKFSLRSSGDYDVSRLAKLFGGGGHKNAAGFSLSAPRDLDASAGIVLWNSPVVLE